MTLDLRHWDILRKRDGADDMVLDGAAIARIPWPRTEAPVKTLASVVACGLMAIPRLSDTLHLQVGDNRLAMANDADPWHATTERLLGKESSPASVVSFGPWFSRKPWPPSPRGRQSSNA